MLRERLILAGLFGLPLLAAAAMGTWSVVQPASAQTTASSSRVDAMVGLVQPSDNVDLACTEKGIIKDLAVEEGDFVKKGQVICQLESSVEEATLQVSKVQAESDIKVKVAKIGDDLARVRLERTERLELKNAAADMEVIEARINKQYTAVKIDEAEHDQKVVGFQYMRDRKVIDRRTIKSPLDGYVARKVKSVGELVDGVDDAVVCQIVQLDPLHVLVPASASTYGKIKTGDTARLDSDQLPGGSAIAKVFLVDRLVQADSQTYTIKLELPNPGSAIPAGIKVMVTFP
jgi:RND family efflux transporter MFP subunit